MQSYRDTEPKLAAAPPMTRKSQRGEDSIMKGSTISVPQQPQTGRTDHRGPMSAMQPVRGTLSTYNAQSMQPMLLPAPAMPYPVQLAPVQPLVPVGHLVAGPPGAQPVAYPHAHPYSHCFPNQTYYQRRPYSSLVPTEVQPPLRPPSPPGPQRSMVPMPHALSSDARIHFTSQNKPGVLVSNFQDDPLVWLDSPESKIACFEDYVQIQWLFTWPGYCTMGRKFKLRPRHALVDLAVEICSALDGLFADVAKNGDRRSEAKQWTVGKQGIRRDQIWLVSFGLIANTGGLWAPEWEVVTQTPTSKAE